MQRQRGKRELEEEDEWRMRNPNFWVFERKRKMMMVLMDVMMKIVKKLREEDEERGD